MATVPHGQHTTLSSSENMMWGDRAEQRSQLNAQGVSLCYSCCAIEAVTLSTGLLAVSLCHLLRPVYCNAVVDEEVFKNPAVSLSYPTVMLCWQRHINSYMLVLLFFKLVLQARWKLKWPQVLKSVTIVINHDNSNEPLSQCDQDRHLTVTWSLRWHNLGGFSHCLNMLHNSWIML